MSGPQPKNLVLIVARELASKLASATFVTDAQGGLVYYNEHAEEILGRSFAEAGEMSAEEWASVFAVEELDGTPLPLEAMPAGIALLERRPAQHTFRIKGLDEQQRIISVTAFPLCARSDEFVGVMSIFWEHPET